MLPPLSEKTAGNNVILFTFIRRAIFTDNHFHSWRISIRNDESKSSKALWPSG